MIDEYYLKNIQEERRALIPQLKEVRSKGHKAIIKYNKLIINNGVLETNEPNKEENKEEQQSTTDRQKRTVVERSPENIDN